MNANSLSSASKAAASSLSSANSQAGNPASKVSATLASGSAAASSYAKGLAGDGTETAKKAGGIFALFSTFNLALVAIALGLAYNYGYLDGVIAYVQNLLNQANDQKERIVKDNTGQTSLRAAAKDQYDATSSQVEKKVNQVAADTGFSTNSSSGTNTTGTQPRAGYVTSKDGFADPMLSQQTTI